MAVRADNGKISENPGPLELTSGCKDAKMCNAAFAKVGDECTVGWGGGGVGVARLWWGSVPFFTRVNQSLDR